MRPIEEADVNGSPSRLLNFMTLAAGLLTHI